ncbi:tRNA splicing endonuclease subunit sen2 [Mortierella sp. GBA35]|nr:tRNA splicing endonuclease subunit sen2 [Mortierella sp. GBA35]
MTTKRNHALKKQLYGIPLPIPALQQHHATTTHQTPATQSNSQLVCTDIATSTRIPSLISILRYLQRQCTTRQSPTQDLIQGDFHLGGASVWIHDSKDMATLFRQGFFGKGTLSRSEATWRERTTGNSQGVSLEELTRQRRVERAQLRKEKLIQAQQGIPAVSSSSTPLSISTETPPSAPSPSLLAAPTVFAVKQLTDAEIDTAMQRPTTISTVPPFNTNGMNQDEHSRTSDDNYEHLQLSLEEAFFLVFAVECISVSERTASSNKDRGSFYTATPLSVQECWLRFAEASVLRQATRSSTSPPLLEISPVNPFIIRYVVYHYYRSLGWVVKDGLKYGTDYLLYKKGLVFGHSQFGVRTIACKTAADVASSTTQLPSISANRPSIPASLLTPTPGLVVSHAAYSWQWLLALNRVISQVQKNRQ